MLQKTEYYSSEIEILLLCARSKLDKDKIARVKALSKKEIDWDYLITVAQINKTMPLLYWHISSICPEQVPKTFLNYLKESFYNNTKSNLYMTKELCKLIDLFDANNIQAIPYKGPLLAISLYNNLALREFSDLDILVHKKDFLKIKNILLQENYHSEHDMNSLQEKLYLEYYCDYSFERDDDMYLEIHWNIAHKYFSIPIDVKQLWERTEKVFIGNKFVQSLSPENLLLILCIHNAKNCWDMLGPICDIAELINARKDINWEYIINTATTAGTKQMLFLGLYLANNILDADIPKIILQEIETNKKIKILAEEVYSRLFGPPKGKTSFLEQGIFQLTVRDHFLNKIKYFIRFATSPSLGDWKWLQLPKHFFFIYYFIRPMRLLKKYLHQLFKVKLLSKFQKTPIEVIDKMLELAEVSSKDIVYDLGCGDGRIAIRAAKKYGVQAIGIDIDPKRIVESKVNAKNENVEHLVRFILQDAMRADFSGATVVTFFLNFLVTSNVGRLLQKQLQEGARIVSHCSCIHEWTPTKTQIIEVGDGDAHTLYLWKIEKPTLGTSNKVKNKQLVSTSTL